MSRKSRASYLLILVCLCVMTRAIPFGHGLKDIKETFEKETNRTLPFGGKWSDDKIKINRRKREVGFNQESISGTQTTDEAKSKNDVKPLYVEVYKTFSDAVVLDWFISLHDKDRMTHCDVTYLKIRDNDDIERHTNNDNLEAKDENANEKNETLNSNSALPFIPASRTFILRPLDANQTYSFQMTCQDSSGSNFATEFLTLNTTLPGTPSISEYHKSLTSTGQEQSLSEIFQDLKFGNSASVPLAAISASSVVHRGSDEDNQRSRRPTNRFANKVSPHLVLGAACGVVGLIIVAITVGLAFTKYSKHKRSRNNSCNNNNNRLWESEPVQENEVSIINCPPPYTEEQSPPQYSLSYSNNNNNSLNNNISGAFNYSNNNRCVNNNNNNIYRSLPTQLFSRSSIYLTEENSSTQLFLLSPDDSGHT